MWWFSPHPNPLPQAGEGVRAQRGRVRACALLLVMALAGCGFAPMYRRDGASASVPQMAAVEIAPADSRLTQLIRNNLLDRLTPEGIAAAPLYRLQLGASEALSGILITRADTTTRYNLSVNANYSLIDRRSGEVLLSGGATSLASYNVLRAEFANVIAEQDARARAAREVAEQIRTRLAVYFETRDRPR